MLTFQRASDFFPMDITQACGCAVQGWEIAKYRAILKAPTEADSAILWLYLGDYSQGF